MDYKKMLKDELNANDCRIETEGKVKLMTDQLYNQVLTICDCELLKFGDKYGCVILFREFPNAYYNGGYQMIKLCKKICEQPDILADIQKNGLSVKLEKKYLKEGKTLTCVNIL